MILDQFETLSDSQRQLFSDTVNKLLGSGFLARDKRDNKEMYYFVLSFKHYFDEFLGIIKFELLIDREHGAIQLINQDNQNLLKLKKDESLILLILRILYHQHLVSTSINDNVIITVDEVHQKYDALELKKKINKTDLVSILRLYRKYNLIEPLGDPAQPNTRIVLYPTLLLAIQTQNINEVLNTIQQVLNKGGATE